MNPIQRHYFSKMLRQQPAPRPTEAVPRLSECGCICLLSRYTSEPEMLRDWEVIKAFHQDFQMVLFYEGKPYQGLIFNKLNVIPFAASHFNFFGRVPADVLDKVQSRHYGLMVNTVAGMDDRLAMLHRWIPADFKIGRDVAYGKFNDLSLMLNDEDDLCTYLNNVKAYLDRLNG
jgi:hypothetical protein